MLPRPCSGLLFDCVPREHAFVLTRHPRLRSRVVLGLVLLSTYVGMAFLTTMLLEDITFSDTDEGNRARGYRCRVWMVMLAVCVTGIGVHLLPFNCLNSRRAQAYELGISLLAVLLCVLATLQHPWYVAELAGSSSSELIPLGYVTDSDHLLLLDVWITGCHFMLPIRWVALLPLEVTTVLCYLVPSVTLGSSKDLTACSLHHVLLVMLCCAASLGKRDLETHERAAFVQVAEERALRAMAENQLHHRAQGASIDMLRQKTGSEAASTIARSLPETTPTGQIFCGFEGGSEADLDDDVQEKMERMIKVGLDEHWLVQFADLRPNPGALLASGGFGTVTAALYYGAEVVVKMPKNVVKRHLFAMAHELRIFRRIRHPNIVNFFGACIDPTSPDILLIIERVRGSELREEVSGPCSTNFLLGFRCHLLNDLCCAISYLHAQKPPIIHGDLKNSNILVERQGMHTRSKLLDFGLSRLLTPNARELGGTVRWMAPEVIMQEQSALALSADIFSLGRLIYFIIVGNEPLHNLSQDEIIVRARAGRNVNPRWPAKSAGILCRAQAKATVEACTAFQPLSRPSIADVQERLAEWADATDSAALSAILSKAFPCPKSVIADFRTALIAKGCTEKECHEKDEGVSMLYPDLEETPLPARMQGLLRTMMAWNVPRDGKACCGLHVLLQEVQQIVESMSVRQCCELKSSNVWQCRRCMLLVPLSSNERGACVHCGYIADRPEMEVDGQYSGPEAAGGDDGNSVQYVKQDARSCSPLSL